MQFFHIYGHINVFKNHQTLTWKMSGLKKFKNGPLKNSYTAETGNWKSLFDRHQNNTAIGVDYLT